MHSWPRKGLTKTDDEKADMYVGYQIAVDQEKQWNAYGMGGALGRRHGQRDSNRRSALEPLCLICTNRGQRSSFGPEVRPRRLIPAATRKRIEKNLDKAMAKLLKNYPPPAK